MCHERRTFGFVQRGFIGRGIRCFVPVALRSPHYHLVASTSFFHRVTLDCKCIASSHTAANVAVATISTATAVSPSTSEAAPTSMLTCAHLSTVQPAPDLTNAYLAALPISLSATLLTTVSRAYSPSSAIAIGPAADHSTRRRLDAIR